MLEIRPAADEAQERVSLGFYNAVWTWDAISMDEVRSFKDQVRDYVDLIAYADGTPLGSAAAAVVPSRPSAAYVILTVPREHRRRGTGSSLLDAATRWAADRDLAALEGPAPEDDADGVRFAGRHGFVEVGREGRLVLDLSTIELPVIDPPAGVHVVTWAERPELAPGMYEVAREAFPDVPGDEDDDIEPYDDWLRHHMGGSGDVPEATFVALAGDEVVGYAKFSLTSARPTVATHDMTGVKRAWRGRGVAGALKRAEIAWAKENGYIALQTQNEMRNEPIRRLNRRLGYKPAPGRILFARPLDG